MALKRGKLEGVRNILYFNRHWYLAGLTTLSISVALAFRLQGPTAIIWQIVNLFALLQLLLSLAASWYIYDHSQLYELHYIPAPQSGNGLNIHAGFDEIGDGLKDQFPGISWQMIDFYDPGKHTEVSIRRARKRYAQHTETISVNTTQIPFADDSFAIIVLFLSAHEIRDAEERAGFFAELRRVLQPGGCIFMAEHMRNTANLIVYGPGAFHFYTKASWQKTLKTAGLHTQSIEPHTAFLSFFKLTKHDISS